MPTHAFRIVAPVDVRKGFVEMDGRRLEGVSRIAFEARAGGPTLVTLEITGNVVVDGELRESAILRASQANPDFHGRS